MSVGHASKLDERKVREIKALLRQGYSGVGIARQYGVTKSMISKIGKGERWGWVD